MKKIAYIAQSLDGYIAGPKGELDWLAQIDNPQNSDFGFSAFMSNVDALLMGRNTFEKVASFPDWPYDKPVYVASNTLLSLPLECEGKAFLISGDLNTMIEKLESKGVKGLYIDGGKLIQSALRCQQLDELIVTTIPVLLGQGIPLFCPSENVIALKLMTSEILLDQCVKTHYRVIKPV